MSNEATDTAAAQHERNWRELTENPQVNDTFGFLCLKTVTKFCVVAGGVVFDINGLKWAVSAQNFPCDALVDIRLAPRPAAEIAALLRAHPLPPEAGAKGAEKRYWVQAHVGNKRPFATGFQLGQEWVELKAEAIVK